MTLPDERSRAVVRTREFLRRILHREYDHWWRKLPEEVRQEAYKCLRHYPFDFHFDKPEEHFAPVPRPNEPEPGQNEVGA